MADKKDPEVEEAPEETPEEKPRSHKRKARTAPPPVEAEEVDDPILDLDGRVTDLEEYRMKKKTREEAGEPIPWLWIAIAGAVLVALVVGTKYRDRLVALLRPAPAAPPSVGT
jgi:hypothetical protein